MNGITELLEMAPKERINIEYLFLPESVLRIEEDRELLEELRRLAEKNEMKVVYLAQGERIRDGDMEFLCLYPEKGNVETSNYESLVKKQVSSDERNNQSLVLLMQYHNFDMLLTGDVESKGEREILEYIDQTEMDVTEIDVLKVAHHGSSGSCTEDFLKVFQPKLSLISCGKNNPYGHPHEETLERLKAVESEVKSTVDSGAIVINVNGRKAGIKYYKH